MSNSAILKSSLAKKYWMSATGLFLCLFLVGHLAGNLQLFLTGEEAALQFNAYAKFMTTNPAVKILSYLTYFSILFHAIDGIMLVASNKAARPQKYAYSNPSANSKWNSRNMGVLGTIILVFIAVHMSNFWYVMHFGSLPVDSAGNKDLYTVVISFFTDDSMGLIFVLFYVFAMAAMCFHLLHGFKSAFSSFGLRTAKTKVIFEKIGYAFSIVVSIAFAAIPVYIYLTH